MKTLFINGKTEKEILEQILKFQHEIDIEAVLKDYEAATGLDSLKKNMQKYFEVK